MSVSSSQPPKWLAMNTAENNIGIGEEAENEVTHSWSKEEEKDHFAALTDVDASRAHGQASSASGPKR